MIAPALSGKGQERAIRILPGKRVAILTRVSEEAAAARPSSHDERLSYLDAILIFIEESEAKRLREERLRAFGRFRSQVRAFFCGRVATEVDTLRHRLKMCVISGAHPRQVANFWSGIERVHERLFGKAPEAEEQPAKAQA